VTPQQTRIAELVALGKTNRQIAVALGCSPRTVGNTLSMLYARLGISTRAELAVRMVSRPEAAGSGPEDKS
jgi:DNA-binding CsgD family transcriptional regulator